MSQVSGVVLGLAYILGLLSTAIPWGGVGMFALGVGVAVAVPRYCPSGPRARLWFVAGTVGLFATFYFQLRVPYPGASDVSKFVAADGAAPAQAVTVQGRVDSLPRQTRSQKGKFWLRAAQLNPVEAKAQLGVSNRRVTGKLYVTAPLNQTKKLQPGQLVAVTGSLYKPKPALNPQGFDFQAYLRQEGAFAGLNGRRVSLLKQKATWGWWSVRQRITHSQGRWLGVPEGSLVSAMVLGSQSVELPFETRDQFIRVGLAHALAASGFQTTLILAVVLALTRQLDPQKQSVMGAVALVTFACLSGFEPAVSRAVLMGFGALVALVTKRKSRPVAGLLGTAVILLLYNPLWVWDLGFQLSFLATLGLIVTVPILTQQLDWLS
ncbi:MAG TPA: ComEC family competence protein, partial [Candidatus Caenarcaniphilales bacterium]